MRGSERWCTLITQQSTKHTPFEVMFERMAKLPVDFNIAESYYPEEKVEEYEAAEEPSDTERQAKRSATEEAMKKNTAAAWLKRDYPYTSNRAHLNPLSFTKTSGQTEGSLQPQAQKQLYYIIQEPKIIIIQTLCPK